MIGDEGAKLKTIAQTLSESSLLLEKISDSARLNAECLLARSIGKERSFLYAWPEQELSSKQLQQFNTYLNRRENGEPIAHILGMKEFWSLPFKVNTSTLIPRPETELLVETALTLFNDEFINVVDLGTGSGAIILALANEREQWNCFGSDRQQEALLVAEQNRLHLNLNNVRFYTGNWYEALPKKNYQLIISNPPYIDIFDPHLNEGDVRFEPRSALVADDHGLADIKKIIKDGVTFLDDDGYLLLEHGWQQGQAVRDFLNSCCYGEIRTLKDLAGHERVSIGRKTSA